MASPHPIRVLFLCTQNAARSQMAEAFLRHHGGARFAAGSEPAERVHPLAERVMREYAIPLTGQRPKSLDQFIGQSFDYIITTRDPQEDRCLTFPGDPERITWGFEDPAKAAGTEEERVRVFRRVRGEIQRRVQLFLELPAHRAGGR